MSDIQVCYAYDPSTGEFAGETIAHPSPLEPSVFLPPAFTTPIPPPALTAHQAAVFRNGEWSVIADLRGELWYKGEAQHVIDGLGDPLEHGLTPAPVLSLVTRKTRLVDQVRADAQAARDDVISPAKLRLLQFDVTQAAAIQDDLRSAADRAALAEFEKVKASFARIERHMLKAEIEIETLSESAIDAFVAAPFTA